MSAIHPAEKSASRMARLAGLSYALYTAAGLYITFGPIPSFSRLADQGAETETLGFLFRTGLLAEVLLYTFVIVSAAAMYVLLRSVSQGGALIAAFCRLIEGAMGATFIIFKYAAFAAVMNPELTPAFSGEEQVSLMLLLRDVTSSALYFLLIPMAFGGVIFFALFFRSRYIPRWLSGWGMFTYFIVGTLAASIVLYPSLEQHVMLFFLPGALFEWVLAFWLIFAGVNTQRLRTSSPAAD
ncbi:DUF4386 domain-containing protein [Oceanicaulis alexandrii]|uniref:DUF4386 domain-containing protein n=1 Tax=Oceanicaulis alexandrii TaxID=153233 RepID=UPI002352FCE2|nr:DUF4386 domain-containing protein [Oceanicaulis alexandrii]